MTENKDVPTHPVQNRWRPEHEREQARAPQVVTLRAYEVYAHVHGPQEAIITGHCRGGFSVAELIAFLYAYPFPRNEWRDRVREALNGMVTI